MYEYQAQQVMLRIITLHYYIFYNLHVVLRHAQSRRNICKCQCNAMISLCAPGSTWRKKKLVKLPLTCVQRPKQVCMYIMFLFEETMFSSIPLHCEANHKQYHHDVHMTHSSYKLNMQQIQRQCFVFLGFNENINCSRTLQKRHSRDVLFYMERKFYPLLKCPIISLCFVAVIPAPLPTFFPPCIPDVMFLFFFIFFHQIGGLWSSDM